MSMPTLATVAKMSFSLPRHDPVRSLTSDRALFRLSHGESDASLSVSSFYCNTCGMWFTALHLGCARPTVCGIFVIVGDYPSVSLCNRP